MNSYETRKEAVNAVCQLYLLVNKISSKSTHQQRGLYALISSRIDRIHCFCVVTDFN